MGFVLGIIYVLVVGAVLVSMAALYLLVPDKGYKKMYLGCQAAVVVWCMSQIFLLLSESTWQLVTSYVIGNIGICAIGALWYCFACEYTGKKQGGVMKYVPGMVAAFHYLMVITSPVFHMYYKRFDFDIVEHGVFFYTNVIATYIFVVMGAVLLYADMGEASGKRDGEDTENGEDLEEHNSVVQKKKVEGTEAAGQKEKPAKSDSTKNGQFLIVASVLIPVFLNAVYLSGLVNSTFDITPLGFGISIILVLLATMKYHFMDFERELAITNEKLLLERERNRIAQQVHDTAGHTLTMIQSYMKLAQVSNDKGDSKETGTYLSEARTLTSQGIKELREAINEMRQEASYELVTQGIMQLAGRVKEIPVEVTVKGEDGGQYSHLSRMLYDCTRESITNTLKYAGASRMDIVLKFKGDCLDLIISDDGRGCEAIKDNNGLSGIRRRVEEAGGTVRFISSDGEGFLTRIHVRVKKGLFS
ncbi:MAG: hypothetical protein IJ661_02670 [Lachnospiraceae bacterium]|nr:hypothetical protein [Lachnospiraceae bacterium]